MQFLLSEQTRLLLLVGACGLLWSLESIVPLYRYQHRGARRAFPNIALALILILTNLALSFSSAYVAAFSVSHGIGLLTLFSFPGWLSALMGVAALDVFAYLAHVVLHKSWLGWQFHRVHHSENTVDVTTTFRQHPGETVWRIMCQLAAVLVFGLPLWVVATYLIFSALNAQLEHANIRLSNRLDRLLRLFVVTPNMHKVHHSRDQRQTDSNYSNIFSIWDRVFGTYTAQVNFVTLRYGLDGFDVKERQTVRGLLKMPFSSYVQLD